MFAEPLLRAQERAMKSKSPVRKFLWRKRVWFESTFALSVMEPWERTMVLIVFFIIWALTAIAAYRALPGTLHFWTKRMDFYLHGNETTRLSSFADMSIAHSSL
ncbi:hypothetical protein RhiJN_28629 [Ceratobasidium sp. AG-Ba]|nr:hypothetical protein RhiJN_28629 [Ceratobasidium sp. AG-Ba]